MSVRWWEKTVEYKFLMSVASQKKLFLAPLDGEHEQAGDAIFSANNRWLLIEFKKDSTAIRSEMEKFIQYDKARKILSSYDAHHYIVYGKASSSVPAKLELYAHTYFSRVARNLNDMLSSGKQFPDFSRYIEQYIKLKKCQAGGSGSRMTIEDYSLVAGVNADNHVVECLSLSEFQRQLGLELQQEHNRTRGYDGPSL
jgi:hypothetical protein